jgi:recombinational DNA repair protein RecT
MAKKTVLKRLCKTLPASAEFAKALDADNCAETGARFIDIDRVTENQIVDQTDGFEPPADEQPKAKADALADKLGG